MILNNDDKAIQMVKWLAGVVTILIVGAITFAILLEMRRNAILACIVSIHQGLINLNLSESDLPNAKSEWTLLSESDGSRIILAASKVHSFDCSRVKSGEPYLDYWGGHLQIGARRLPSGKLEYRVWSKGSDGDSMTSDDLVSPYGEKALVSK